MRHRVGASATGDAARGGTGTRRWRFRGLPCPGTIEQRAYGVSESKHDGPRGPAVIDAIPAPRPTPRPARRERVFGGPAPEGPLPGHLLVLLSRLHRAEAVKRDQREGQRG